MPPVFKIDPAHPDLVIIAKAVEIMRKGGVIAYPTETFYGLGTVVENEGAITRLFSIKGRRPDKPIPLIVGARGDVKRYVLDIPADAEKLMDHYWPGALSMLFRAALSLPGALTADTGKVAIRYSGGSIAALLAATLPGAITSTSANLSDEPACVTAAEVVQSLGERVDAIIDGGETPGGMGSTIIDVTLRPPVVIRRGAVVVDEGDLKD